ncbi:MAG: 50S ribosomal protein L10 [Candidatus Parcubacteria bacterium]|nr:50S ribosomal protein L10 [Candidatus Parcubacteria bacterium]
MAINKAKKVEILEHLKGIAKGEGSRVFVNFHGVSVSDVTAIRRALHQEGIGYFVSKKTLARKVFNEAGIDGEFPELSGELAIAYGEDPIAPAREMQKFQKTLKEKISILGGVFEHRFVGADEMKVIASIPTRQILYGQFVNLINSPIQGLVISLDGIAQKKEAV